MAGKLFLTFLAYNLIDPFVAKLWQESCFICQVKSGTLFDNVLITDDPEYAKQLAEETWGKQKDVSDFIHLIFWSKMVIIVEGYH